MALYEFVDTTETPKDAGLPAEAMMWNGDYLENQIEGYRTLYVTGREALSPEVTTYTVGTRDGSGYQTRRFPERKITVGYQLIAKDDATFREAFNKLNYVLSETEVQIIFRDEPDKYFTGTVSEHSDSYEPGANKIVSELVITCADPFKYSVSTVEIKEQSGQFAFDYAGTFPAHPVLEADFYEENDTDGTVTGKGNCGFVAFFNDDAQTILIGDETSTEEEQIEIQKSEILFSQSFKEASSIPDVFEQNKGPLLSSSGELDGTPIVTLYSPYADDNGVSDGCCVGVTEYGSGAASLYRSIPQSSLTSEPLTNWTLTWESKFAMDSRKSWSQPFGKGGNFEMLVCTSGGLVIAGLIIMKGTSGTTAATMYYYVNNKKQSSSALGTAASVDLITPLSCTIVKSGKTVTFTVNDQIVSYTDSNLADEYGITADHVVVGFVEGTDFNFLRSIKFVGNYSSEWVDAVPDTYFVSGDVVTADCGLGEIKVNGTLCPSYGALGNDWETFVIRPGLNQIGTAYSDWTEQAPTFKLSYREVYL